MTKRAPACAALAVAILTSGNVAAAQTAPETVALKAAEPAMIDADTQTPREKQAA